MGAAESRQGGGIDQDHDDLEKKKGESSTGSGAGTALASAAVWTALLGVAGVYHNIDGMILMLPLSMAIVIVIVIRIIWLKCLLPINSKICLPTSKVLIHPVKILKTEMGGSSVAVFSPPKVCQFCKEEGHYASECPYIGLHCPNAPCWGFMRVAIEYNEIGTLENKYLKCSVNYCRAVQEIYTNKEVIVSVCQLCKEQFPLCKECHLCDQCHLPNTCANVSE